MKPLEEYITIEAWCKDFKKENKRKATFDDFFKNSYDIYFPNRCDKECKERGVL